jgi:hypothetical protein
LNFRKNNTISIIVYKKINNTMNKQELIEKIKTQLKSLVSSEVKFAEQKAGDRLIVTPDENFMINSEVYLRDEEGNNVPLLDGEYIFDDGVKIVVEAGKIKAMVEPEAELEDEETDDVQVEETDDVQVDASEDNKETPKEDAMEKLMAKIKMIEEKVEEMAKKFEEVEKENEQMKQEFSKIAEQPSTSKIETAVAEFKSLEEKANSIGAVDIMAIREKARRNNR